MSIRAYRAALAKLLDSTTRPIAAEVCFKLWDDYIANGIYLDPEYVKTDIACAEGHLTNPPEVLPEEGIEINPGSRCFAFYLCDDQQRGCIMHRASSKQSFDNFRTAATQKERSELDPLVRTI